MAKLTEIAEVLMARNGHFIFGDFVDLEWKLDSFWKAIKPEIDYYGQFCPIKKQFNVAIPSGPLTYNFTYDKHNEGYVAGTDTHGEPPLFLTDVLPVTAPNLLSTMVGFISPMLARDTYQPTRLIEPRPFLWDYTRPILHTTEMGMFDIRANYKYQYIETRDTNNVLTEVEIPKLDSDANYHYLIQLLSGRFLKSVGMSLSIFTYTEMPITTNADKLIELGTTEYDEAVKNISNNHNWFDSMRS